MPNDTRTPFDRGRAAAQRELDNLAGYRDVDRRAEAASVLLDGVTFNAAGADPVRAAFDAGYRQALNDAIAEAKVIRCAACGSDEYAVADLQIASGVCCTIAPTQLILDVLAVVAPRTVGELIDIADMVCDAELGVLDVATVIR